MSGLSRRRVAGAVGSSAVGTASADGNGTPERALSRPSTRPTSPKLGLGVIAGAGTDDAGMGGHHHRIVYDPRDLADEGREATKPPRLTLMEEVLLLGLKDKQGYLSFWNDNISYALRGCILLELAMRGRIAIEKDPRRKRFALADRLVEVVDERLTGEVLLDEALKMMNATPQGERMSVSTWIDLMSGETWNLMKIGYQLKQVRERLAKGLVDKGILRTEKRNFLLFDMATHPVVDGRVKEEIVARIVAMLVRPSAPFIPNNLSFFPESTSLRWLRTVALVCAAYAANVLENALSNLGHEAREACFGRVDELLDEFSQVPFAIRRAGEGSLSHAVGQEVESLKEQQLEVLGAVLQVFGRLDSIL